MSVRRVFCLILLAALTACGEHPSDDSHPNATVTSDPAGQKAITSAGAAPDISVPPPPVQTSDQTQVQQPQAVASTPNPPQAQPAASASASASDSASAPSPLVTKGVMQTAPEAWEVPDKLRAKIDPSQLPPPPPNFSITDQHLTIDAKNQKVTFSGTLKVVGQQDEAFTLACNIDTSAVPWVCTNMFPTDPVIGAQKRIQGTFKCEDAYQCSSVGVQVWVVINGKLQPPQLFEADGFQARVADDGDTSEDEQESGDVAATAPVEAPAAQAAPAPVAPSLAPAQAAPIEQPVIAQPVAQPLAPAPQKLPLPPAPSTPINQPVVVNPPVTSPPAPVIRAQSAQSEEALLEDPDTAIEYTEPMKMPNPSVGTFSLPGIEKLPTDFSKDVKVQAVGLHARGRLQAANEFASSGEGYISRDHGKKDFGTDLMVNLISQALAATDKAYPGRPPVVLGSVANHTGGQMYNLSNRPHASHQTGLDADVGYPSLKKETGLWYACTGGCHTGSKIVGEFDDERFWYFLKQVNCAENSPVIAMFLDRNIKKHLCTYVQQRAHEDLKDPNSCAYKTLRAIVHIPGHDTHVHVRLRCPENSVCRNNNVSLPKGTGC